ncbi:MAG: hypothetical protein QG597_1856 [Actinomycetota bacterium]|nr:hypothetical protein [Actinomycetota bacterium]
MVAGVAAGCLLVGVTVVASADTFDRASTTGPVVDGRACSVMCSDSPEDDTLRAGNADAWPTLQGALNAALPGTEVAVPPGRFVLSHPLEVPSAVVLAGAGQGSTTLTAAADAGANFRHEFLVGPAGGGQDGERRTVVRDLTLDGGHAGEADLGVGGVRMGDGWLVNRVRLANLGYFKVWLHEVDRVSIVNSVFADHGGASGGEDNIGGGGATGVVITGNTFEESARGNSIDLVRSTDVLIEGNTMSGTPQQPHNVYLEGIVGAQVRGNQLAHSSIAVQSNADYETHGAVVNSRDVVIEGNAITDAEAQGISLRYDAPRLGQPGTVQSGAVGGGNSVVGNIVTRSGVAGIVVIAAAPGLVGEADAVSDNTVIDAFADGEDSWNCGYGITQAAGIVIGAGHGVHVQRNTVTDSGVGSARVGLAIGVRSGRGVKVSVIGAETTRVEGIERSVVVQS